MLNCLNEPGNLAGNGSGVSVFERQRARLKWQQELQQEQTFLPGNELDLFALPSQAPEFSGLTGGGESGLGDLVSRVIKADPCLENAWPDFEPRSGYGFGPNYAISRTISCTPEVVATAEAAAAAAERFGRESTSSEKLAQGVGKESFRKRKADKVHKPKVVAEDETSEKRAKGSAGEGEFKKTQQRKSNNCNSNNNSAKETSEDNSKVTEVQPKPDYIHVRARRGQATDSHSLAERVRRERISERMKYLQDLVPGCNKITGKAGMLDEIINYVQSLQRQVEFLSMKLAAINPTLDFNIESFFVKEIMPACTANYPATSLSPEMANPAYLQYNPLQQSACCGLEMGLTPDIGFRRTVSAPASIPEAFPESSCFNQIQPTTTWDAELQNLYAGDLQERSTPFLPQIFAGSVEAGNLKMEI